MSLPCLILVATACVPLMACQPTPPTADEPPDAPCSQPPSRPPSQRLLAGSGSSLAPGRLIAREAAQGEPELTFAVAPSIGTRGAIAALLDGAIDVGLASRPLSARERAAGVRDDRVATTPLVVAVHLGVRAHEITTEDLVRIYTGTLTHWPDGTAIVPLRRQRGDSATALLGRLSAELDAALSAPLPHSPICFTDAQMLQRLARTPGAIGYADLGTINLERRAVRPLLLNGVEPSADNLAQGRYPLGTPLLLLTPERPNAAARAILEASRTVAVRTQLEQAGYVVEAGK